MDPLAVERLNKADHNELIALVLLWDLLNQHLDQIKDGIDLIKVEEELNAFVDVISVDLVTQIVDDWEDFFDLLLTSLNVLKHDVDEVVQPDVFEFVHYLVHERSFLEKTVSLGNRLLSNVIC